MDERKREKQEEKVARDRVKAQIEADKLARKKLFGQVSGEEQPKPVAPIITPTPLKQSKDYTETKLQVLIFILTHHYLDMIQLNFFFVILTSSCCANILDILHNYTVSIMI